MTSKLLMAALIVVGLGINLARAGKGPSRPVGGKVGGLSNVSFDDTKLKDALREAIVRYNNAEHDHFPVYMKLDKIIRANQQVVNGLRYNVDFNLVPTVQAVGDKSITADELDKFSVNKKQVSAH